MKTKSLLLAVVFACASVLHTGFTFAAFPSQNPLEYQPGDVLEPTNWNELVRTSIEAKLRLSDNIFSNGGNVGIGTGTADEKLHVYGGGLLIEDVNDVGNLVFRDHSGSLYLGPQSGASADGAYISVAGSEVPSHPNPLVGAQDGSILLSPMGGSPNYFLNVTTTGIGIGTANPTAKLEVAGDMILGGDGGSGRLLIGGAYSTGQDDKGPNSRPFKLVHNGENANNHLRIGTDTGHGGDAAIEIYQNYAGGNEQKPGKVVVNGKVGIGTLNPSETLDVNGDIFVRGQDMVFGIGSTTNVDSISYNDLNGIGIGGDGVYTFLADTTRRAAWTAPTASVSAYGAYFKGNVGIGTTSPSGTLHVDGGTADNSVATGTPIAQFARGAGGGNFIAFYADAFANYIVADDSGTNQKPLHLQTRNNNDIILNPHGTGKVGIGTANPSAKLDVRGTLDIRGGNSSRINLVDNDHDNFVMYVNSDALYFLHDDNNNLKSDDGEENRIVMRRGSTGGIRLGVGTSSPSNKLEVAGKIEADKYCDRDGDNCFDFNSSHKHSNSAWTSWYRIVSSSRNYSPQVVCPAGKYVTGIQYHDWNRDYINDDIRLRCTEVKH